MMQKFFLFTCLIASNILYSQITITSTDMPVAGDSIRVGVTYTVGANDPTIAGANYNLDYSTLTPNSKHYEKFDNPMTFTSPFNLLFNIFNTSYGKENYAFTAIPGVPITSAYDFFKKSNSSLKQIGSGFFVNGTPLPFYYTAADVVYKFPLDYLNTDSCDYKFGLPIPTFGYYGQTGHRVNVVDGWGSITTPYGTFQSVRVKSTIATIDTVFSTAVNFGLNIPRPLKYEFKWLVKGLKIPVLEVDESDIAGNMTITNVQYIDSIPSLAGIIENSKDNFNLFVYPNPCTNNFTLEYLLSNSNFVKANITDIIGKEVIAICEEKQSRGFYQKSIATNQLSPGIYFLKFEAGDNKGIQKIIVTR